MMSSRYLLAVTLITAVAAVGVGQQPPAVRGEQARHSRNLNYGNWVGKRVLTKEFIEQVGISPEQAAKLKETLDALDARATKLDEEINQAALEQAKIAKQALSEPGASMDEVMQKIEQIGKMRTEQAKLTTLVLVAIRDNLTDEQRKKANEIIASEGKKRMQERTVRHEREERERGGTPLAPGRPAAPKGW